MRRKISNLLMGILWLKGPFVKVALLSSAVVILFIHVEIFFGFDIFRTFATFGEEYIIKPPFLTTLFCFDFLFILPFLLVSASIFYFCSRNEISTWHLAAFILAVFFVFTFMIKIHPLLQNFFVKKFMVFVIALQIALLPVLYFSIRLFLNKNLLPGFFAAGLVISAGYFASHEVRISFFLSHYLAVFSVLVLVLVLTRNFFTWKIGMFFYAFLAVVFTSVWFLFLRFSSCEVTPTSLKYSQPIPTETSSEKFLGAPNVIVIVLDTFRGDYLDLSPEGTTPNLAAFARGSVVYENCVSTSSWTLPAHASLFTGLYPTTHGAHCFESNEGLLKTGKKRAIDVHETYCPLGAESVTMAEVLHKNGYRTYGVVANSLYANHVTGLSQGFEVYDDRENPLYPILFKNDLKPIPILSHLADALSDLIGLSEYILQYHNKPFRTAESINETVEKILHKSSAAPFFLFVNYMDMHEPHIPAKKYREKFIDKIQRQWFGDREKMWGGVAEFVDVMKNKKEFSLKAKKHMTACYQAEAEYLDEHLGNLFKYLRKAELYDNSLIIVTSDHGEQLGEHYQFGHRVGLYNESIMVPLMVKYPKISRSIKAAPPAEVIHEDVQLTDVLPTVLCFLGIAVPQPMEGVSLFDLKRGRRGDRYLIAELDENIFAVMQYGSLFSGITRSITRYPFKYIWNSERGGELFDLAADPREVKNIANERSDIAVGMKSELDKWVNERKLDVKGLPGRQVGKSAISDEKEINRLKSFGYL